MRFRRVLALGGVAVAIEHFYPIDKLRSRGRTELPVKDTSCARVTPGADGIRVA